MHFWLYGSDSLASSFFSDAFGGGGEEHGIHVREEKKQTLAFIFIIQSLVPVTVMSGTPNFK